MTSGKASRSALAVAAARASHQLFDNPPAVFEDPLATAIIGEPAASDLAASGERERNPHARAFRAFIVARSRYAEDQLARAVERGVGQYVILGAGLDTFAYRSPYADQVRVFEVDQAATQDWKRQRLAERGLAPRSPVVDVALDLEAGALAETLVGCGYDPAQPALVSWLGVTPYVAPEVFWTTIRSVASLRPGSEVVFDYLVARSALAEQQRQGFDLLAAALAAGGEPFRSTFLPDDLPAALTGAGLHVSSHCGGDELHARYFAGRADGLSPRGSLARLITASV